MPVVNVNSSSFYSGQTNFKYKSILYAKIFLFSQQRKKPALMLVSKSPFTKTSIGDVKIIWVHLQKARGNQTQLSENSTLTLCLFLRNRTPTGSCCRVHLTEVHIKTKRKSRWLRIRRLIVNRDHELSQPVRHGC